MKRPPVAVVLVVVWSVLLLISLVVAYGNPPVRSSPDIKTPIRR